MHGLQLVRPNLLVRISSFAPKVSLGCSSFTTSVAALSVELWHSWPRPATHRDHRTVLVKQLRHHVKVQYSKVVRQLVAELLNV